jgi:DNA adenine methylase
MQRSKPFIKWAGGKGQLIPTLIKYLPKDFSSIDDVTYIEPFVGGGAMLFYLLQNFDNIKRAVINDVNEKLIVTYMTIKKNPHKLITELSEIQKQYYLLNEDNRKDYYLDVRDEFNKGNLSDIEISKFMMFLNRTCFNGLYRVNSKGKYNVAFGRYANPKICDADTILADNELLQRVEIICGDFEQTEKYINNHSLFYFDPPYRPINATSNFTSYNPEDFDDDEQIRLKYFLDKVSEKGCSFMLSNSDGRGRNPDNTFLDDLYNNFFIERVIASRSINVNPNKRGKLTELLVRNYEMTQSTTNRDNSREYLNVKQIMNDIQNIENKYQKTPEKKYAEAMQKDDADEKETLM